MTDATKAIAFLQTLKIPEGPRAGKRLKLAPFQRRFVCGAMKRGVSIGVLSVARGNGKTGLSAGLALAALLGVWDDQPKRTVLLAARTRDQGRIAFDFATGFAESLPDELRERLTIRRNPRLEIELEGGHLLRVLASDARNALGSAPTFVLMDERGSWKKDQGDDLEASLLSGLGKRQGRAVIISTSAPTDDHAFSRWLDEPPPGTYVQEHRASMGVPVDDVDAIKAANPGAVGGIGAPVSWLQAQAQRAIARGGSALASFRLYNLNQRVSDEHRSMLIPLDQWLACETDELPPRQGPCVAGIDLGGTSSMTAGSLYWYETGRLEAFGAFPATPTLADRGERDGVKGRYVEMADRGELRVMGTNIVDTADFLHAIVEQLDGATLACFTCDRYRAGEFQEAMTKAGVRVPVVYRGAGFRDGGEDVERFRQATFDKQVHSVPSLLLRSAFSDAIVLLDPANNAKLAKGRSLGRIDAASATVVAVAEGMRRKARPARQAKGPVWA